MKVIKPQSLSLLSRPFEYRNECFLGLSVVGMVPMGERRVLRNEIALWPLVAEALGAEGVLDDCIPKRRSEYLVAGNAWPAADSDRSRSRIRVQLGRCEKTLNVFGDRFFDGDRVSEPGSFDVMPLGWQQAFGGESFRRNPSGKGAAPFRDANGRKRHPLPNIEYPDDMLTLPGRKTEPAGFGSIPPDWPQRQRKAGTHDARWLRQEYPGFASDIDWTFFNVASVDQQQDGMYSGEERYVIEGMHPEHRRIEGCLPGFTARTFIRRGSAGAVVELPCPLTTVWLFPELEHLVLVFHASTRVEQPDASDVSEVMLAADDLDAPRAQQHYAEVFERRTDPGMDITEALRDQDLLPESMHRDGAMELTGASSGSPENVRTGQLRRKHKKAMDEGRARLEAAMTKIGVELENEPKLPDFGFNPDDPGSITLEKLPEIIDRLEAYSRTEQKAMLARREESGQRLEAGLVELQRTGEGEASMPPINRGGPPEFSAAERIASIENRLAELEQAQADVSGLRTALLDDSARDGLNAAERGLHELYRKSAHYQQPAPRDDSDQDWSSKLRAYLQSGKSTNRADFTGARLVDADLSGLDLTGIYLESADLSGANLQGTVFDGAVLAHATLDGAVAAGASFRGANLGMASLAGATFTRATFDDADLTGADLKEAVLDGCAMNEVELRDARFGNTRMAGVVHEGLVLMDLDLMGQDFHGAHLPEAVFLDCRLAEADFSGARMDGAMFLNVGAPGASFESASLINARWVMDCDCTGVDFRSSNLSEAYLANTRLVRAAFGEACLDQGDLSGSDAGGVDLYRASCVSTRFVAADLRESNLAAANLMEASLERVDLRGGSLKGANLYGADLARIHVDPETDFAEALTTRMRVEPRRFRQEPDS